MLTDLVHRTNGVREFETAKGRWTMIIQGTVGILLDEGLTARWRTGGAEVVMVGRSDARTNRCVMVKLCGKGKGRGLNLIAAYAPTSDYHKTDEREKFRSDLTKVLELAPGGNYCIVGGDFNAEVGPETRQGPQGRIGSPRRKQENGYGSRPD